LARARVRATLSEPVAAIGNPPAHDGNRNGCPQGPPDGQNKICHQAQHNKDDPEDLALHDDILVWPIFPLRNLTDSFAGRDPFDVAQGRSATLFFPEANVYKGAMKRSVRELAELIQARVVGDGAVEVSRVASLQSAGSGDLVFVEDEKNFALALESKATVVIAGGFAPEATTSKPLLICTQPRLAFARAARLLSLAEAHNNGIHSSALVSPSVQCGTSVTVGERAVLGENVQLGDNTRIGAGCVVGANVVIGRDCELYPNVTVYSGVRIGDRVVVHAGAVLGSDGFGYVRDEKTGRYEKFPQIGKLEIEYDVEIGANATIDRGALDVTRVGRGTKIDNLVHIGHNVQVGEDVVIAAQTGLSGGTVVKNNVVIGGQVGIADHVRIEEGAILGAQSGIPSKKIIRGKGVVFWGTPARPIREYLKQLAVLARLAKKE